MSLKRFLLVSLFLLVSSFGFAITPIIGTDHVCQGSSVSLANATTGGTWSSGDPSIASVDAGGVVTGVTAGTTIISYTSGAEVATATFTVYASSPISGPSAICVGTMAAFSNAVSGGTWSSSNTAIAPVGITSGLVSGISFGTVNISYSTPTGCIAQKTVTIHWSPAPITGTPVMCVGGSTTFSNPATGATWSSSNSAILTIDPASGSATAASTGIATISYTLAAGCLVTLAVTVNTNPPAISGTTNVCSGATTTLTAPISSGTWTSGDPSIATVTSTPGSGVVSGISAGTVTLSYTIPSCPPATHSLTVDPLPALSSPLIVPDICDLSLFSYAPTSTTPGTTFLWSRDIVSGIANPAAAGFGMVAETLHNTTSIPVTVAYMYTLTAGGCSNVQTVSVNVNPIPSLTSSLTPPAVCDASIFSYTPTSATPGTSFTWSRATVPGIATLSASGIGGVSEALNNSTPYPVAVTYVYTLTAGSCVDTQHVTLTVNPTPSLTSTTTPPAICDSSLFTYMPSTATPGALFMWGRAYIPGIVALSVTGTGGVFETLDNNTAHPVAVTYLYTVTANGCADTQSVMLTVNPTPTLTSALTLPAICDSEVFNYIPTSATTGVSFSWSRATVTGISNPTASGTGNPAELLVNTTTAPVPVSYVYALAANGCTNLQNVTVTVNPCTSWLGLPQAPNADLTIIPNPVQSELYIHSTNKIIAVTILNTLGQVVLDKNYNAADAIINVADLPAGLYFLKVNNTEIRRLVKQ